MKPLLLRCFLWLFTRLFYRVTVLHPDNVPLAGGALLVSNHVSFVDLLLLLASTRRMIRFLLPQDVCERRWLKPCLRYLCVIPLPSEAQPRDLLRALNLAREAIQQGEVVGIFAEKTISRIGVMLPFRREFERIMDGVSAPIVPVCLDGVWGSIFSYQSGRFFWKLPRRLPYPVTINFGSPMPASATAVEVRTAIQELNTDAWPHRRTSMQPLHRAFVDRARKCPFRFAMADARVPHLSFAGALTKTVFLARGHGQHPRFPCRGRPASRQSTRQHWASAARGQPADRGSRDRRAAAGGTGGLAARAWPERHARILGSPRENR